MDIKETLRLHKLWVEGHPDGSRANLKGANLKGANLKGADLRGAHRYGSTPYGADLRGANLTQATLGTGSNSGLSTSFINTYCDKYTYFHYRNARCRKDHIGKRTFF